MMQEEKSVCECVNCGRLETEAPLVTLRYNSGQVWICTQCLPTLIHHPQQLADKLAGATIFSDIPL
jgi:hypothetical protein